MLAAGVLWHGSEKVWHRIVFVEIAFAFEFVEAVCAGHSVIFLLQPSLFVEIIEVSPVSSAVFSLMCLQLFAAVDGLSHKVLSAAAVVVIDANVCHLAAEGEHRHFVVAE